MAMKFPQLTVLIFFGYYLIVNYNLLNRLILFVLIKSSQRVGVLMRLRNMIPMHGNEITIIQDCHSSHSTLPNLLPPGMEFLSCEWCEEAWADSRKGTQGDVINLPSAYDKSSTDYNTSAYSL
jgi:hypothetical protein